MNSERFTAIAKGYGLTDPLTYAVEAFSRSIGFLDAADLERLSRARVAVPGLGGVGSAHVATLARLGIGAFNLADMDIYNPVNMNRQHGAKVTSWGKPKLDTVAEEALSINPYADLRLFPEGVTRDNIDRFLADVDVVVDGLDFFVFDIRRMLFNRARARGIPVITAGPLGFSSAALVFTPKGMPFDQYFAVNDATPPDKKILHFALGLAPAGLHSKYMDSSAVDFAMKKGPSLIVGCQMSAALAATEAARLILNRKYLKATPYFIQMDPYLKRVKKGKIRKGNRSMSQRFKAWVFENFLLAKGQRLGCEPKGAPDPAPENPPLDNATLPYLLAAGIQAPSGDNVQPWKFTTKDNTITLRADFAADPSFFNVRQLATVIATGAAAENMRIAATPSGLHCNIAVNTHDNTACEATLTFTRDEKIHEDVLADSIWRRHTNRKPYKTKQVPKGIWEHLNSVGQSVGDAHLAWINDPQELATLSKAIFWADRIRAERQDLHEHFMHMVRFAPEEILATRDGLPLGNLEAGPPGNLFLKATKDWKNMRIANMLGIGRMVPVVSAIGIRRCGGVGLLSVPTSSIEDFFTGGRALERIWLTIAHLNMRMQPMTAITLFQLRRMVGEEQQFSSAHRELLRKASKITSTLFPEAEGRAPVMLFRAGFGAPIRHGTYRRPVESFMDKDE